jgi:type IV secretion system protein VirD4
MSGNLVPTGGVPSFLGSEAGDAISLGRRMVPGEGISQKLQYGGPLHVLVFGPNGAGKGTRLLMPNLLRMTGTSLVVVDPKAELAAVTAPFRRQLGRVVVINPFGVLADRKGYGDLASTGFNPLARLDPDSDSFNAEAGLIAEALVLTEAKDPHWTQSARALLAALVMYVVIEAKRLGTIPTMRRVRELLCKPSEEPHSGNDHEGAGIPKLAREMYRMNIPGLANKAAQFMEWNTEIQSIVSTAKIQTEAFDDPEIANDLSKDGFDFRDLKSEPVTVYLVLPPEMMTRHAKWLRLVLTSAFQRLMSVREAGAPKTVFMLDEFAALGHMQIISTVWALVRGYGIQIMPILQDLNQLKMLYPDMWETFIGMAGATASFGPNDLTTAEWLSRRTGDTSRTIATYNEGGGTSATPQGMSRSDNAGLSYSSVKVPLASPHELLGMNEGIMLLTLAGLRHVIPTYAPAFFQIRRCVERARANPYYQV